MEHVRLIGTIYVELLAPHAPRAEEIRIFEQKQINRELKKELKTTLNFLRKTTTCTTKPVP